MFPTAELIADCALAIRFGAINWIGSAMVPMLPASLTRLTVDALRVLSDASRSEPADKLAVPVAATVPWCVPAAFMDTVPSPRIDRLPPAVIVAPVGNPMLSVLVCAL